MFADLYTNKSDISVGLDLCKDVVVREDVKELYYQFKGRCEEYLPFISDAENGARRYYVYAWYAKTEPFSYFYVGKGTGRRYNHILSDIDKYKNGKQNLRFQRYSEIQDKWGIDYVILIDKLTEYEALICEECKKLEFLDKGEVLLNVEGIPDEYLPVWWKKGLNYSVPNLIEDPVYQKYLSDCGKPHFDEVSEEALMRTYIYPYFIDLESQEIQKDKECIIEWLNTKKAKIYKTVSPKTASVIIQGQLRYDTYYEYRSKGKKIFNSKDVIRFIMVENKQ